MTAPALRTRKPTGRVPWPLILVEGAEKAGKSWSAAAFSASPRIGQMYWLDLGEGSADEYGAIPSARYLVIDHDGSWADIIGQVEAVRDEARRAADAGEKPVALVVDSMTAEWELLKDWATNRAKGRRANQEKLRRNPDAEIQISMDLWNDANGRHRRLMTLLMTFPGIVIITARGKEVAALDASGRPVEGSKEYKVEGQKTLAYDCSVWVRMSRDHAPLIVGARSVHAGVRPGVDKPKSYDDFTLEWLVFDHLRCDPTNAHVRDLVQGKPERSPEQIAEQALANDPVRTADELRADYNEARRGQLLTIVVKNEADVDEELGALLIRLGKARAAAAQPPATTNPADNPRVKYMFVLLGKAEIRDRDERLAYYDHVTGRNINSTKDLTPAEIENIIEAAESYIKQNTPPAETGQVAACAT